MDERNNIDLVKKLEIIQKGLKNKEIDYKNLISSVNKNPYGFHTSRMPKKLHPGPADYSPDKLHTIKGCVIKDDYNKIKRRKKVRKPGPGNYDHSTVLETNVYKEIGFSKDIKLRSQIVKPSPGVG